MTRRGLDVYCGAGGATRGYQQAGFHMTGVDSKPQPRYCGEEFIQAGALDVLADRGFLAQFDFIHASPPCQAYSATRTIWNARKDHPDLVAPTREHLRVVGVPWVMENVQGAPLTAHVQLCGTSFGLILGDEWELQRHRLFELSGFFLLSPACQHDPRRCALGVYGNGGGPKHHRTPKGSKASIGEARALMRIDWMTTAEISQAIPPAYTEFIGRALLDVLERAA
jgi:DNA (cytosine-5)-methyltransferase 1